MIGTAPWHATSRVRDDSSDFTLPKEQSRKRRQGLAPSSSQDYALIQITLLLPNA